MSVNCGFSGNLFINGLPADIATGGGGGGATDHGALTGLLDDDHTQYHNDTRGDVRYHVKTNAPRLFSGVANPNGSVLPDKAGDLYQDTDDKILYRASDATNSGWVAI